jgi:hypothetical protein
MQVVVVKFIGMEIQAASLEPIYEDVCALILRVVLPGV